MRPVQTVMLDAGILGPEGIRTEMDGINLWAKKQEAHLCPLRSLAPEA